MKRKLQKTIIFVAVLIYLVSVFCMNVAAADFPDVSKNHNNYTAITELVEKGVIAGYDDGYFRPEREITRTEFCALMARTLGYVKGEYEKIDLPFSDVKEGYWGIDYISFCYELRLIDGMGDGTFWPAEKVTLAQAMKMAVCAIDMQEEALKQKGEKWYDGYVEVAKDFDLFDFVDGAIDNAAIRGDIAQVVYNMVQTGRTNITEDSSEENDDSQTTGDNPKDDEKVEEDEADEEDHIPPEIRAAYKEKDFSQVKTILVDAGHNYSGKDIGAENVELDLKEEIITWQIADKLRDMLEEMGYTVVMTRETLKSNIANTSVVDSLQARVDLGHNSLADLFISIHCNAGGGSGTEVYCFQKGGYAGRLAELVQKNIANRTELYDRGTKTANFFIVQNTLMPAILIETGFIDNPDDVEIIASKKGQSQIAEAIADAVLGYDNMPPIKKAAEETRRNEDDEETGTVGAGGQPE